MTVSYQPSGSAISIPTSNSCAPTLTDPYLMLLGTTLDQAQDARRRAESRLEIVTRTRSDRDGVQRGWGLDETMPPVISLKTQIAGLRKLELQAIRDLEARLVQQSPLAGWIKRTEGLGLKSVGRVLAIIGDPTWNDRDNRERSISQLRSYCGFGDATRQRKTPGVSANWHPRARVRVWNVAKAAAISGPYKEIYDFEKLRTLDSVHDRTCLRCGPVGSPALPGSLRSKGHRHEMARRRVAKAFLKDLWHEAQRVKGVET